MRSTWRGERDEGLREGGHELFCHLGEGLSRSHSEFWAGLGTT